MSSREGLVEVEVAMYSGHMIDELMDMVARAERHAEEIKVAPEPQVEMSYYAPRYLYETVNQHAMAGVA
jgi:hypothetical protein